MNTPDISLLEEMLGRWQHLVEQGVPVDIEEFCRNCPELSDELRRRIHALANGSQRPDPAVPPSEETVRPAGAPTPFPSDAWKLKNARRIELIRKKNRGGLSPAESTEFEQLQRGVLAERDAAFPRPSPDTERLDRLEQRLGAGGVVPPAPSPDGSQ